MAPPYMFEDLNVSSRYLDYQKGFNFRPNEDYFRVGLNKVKILFNTSTTSGQVRSAKSSKSQARSEPSLAEPRSKSAEKRQPGIIHKHMLPPRHPTFIIEDTRKGARKDERVEKAAQERRTRVKITMKSNYSLQRDKEFLELIQSTTRSKSQSDLRVRSLTKDALEYLDTRHEYWRQQIPEHVRVTMATVVVEDDDDFTHKSPQKAMPHVVKQLKKITKMMIQSEYNLAIVAATTLISDVKKMEKRLPGKESVMANCYSILGNAYLETGDTKKAISFHTQDLRFGTEYKIGIAKSRAYDNLGRVYARIGKFQRAIHVWSKKLESQSIIPANEKTWLCHELGHCHLKIGNPEKAREYGEMSHKAASDIPDKQAQLNAYMLVAQAILRGADLYGCKHAIEKALKASVSADDKTNPNSVSDSLNNLRKAIKSFKNKEKEAKASQPLAFPPPRSSYSTRSRGTTRLKPQTASASQRATSAKSSQSMRSVTPIHHSAQLDATKRTD